MFLYMVHDDCVGIVAESLLWSGAAFEIWRGQPAWLRGGAPFSPGCSEGVNIALEWMSVPSSIVGRVENPLQEKSGQQSMQV